MSSMQDEHEEQCSKNAEHQEVGNITQENNSSPSPFSESGEQTTSPVHNVETDEDVTDKCESSEEAPDTTSSDPSEVSYSDNPTEIYPMVTPVIWAEIKTFFEHLHSELVALKDGFDVKLKYDQHKETVIDRQHKELETYRNGLINKLSLQIADGVIQQIDDIESLAAYYPSFLPREDDGLYNKYDRLRNLFIGISESLRDVLERNDIEPYKGEDGQPFDPKQQRVLKKEVTSDKNLDKTVKQSLRWGFRFKGKVIRPEMVEVYVWQPQQKPVVAESTEAISQ